MKINIIREVIKLNIINLITAIMFSLSSTGIKQSELYNNKTAKSTRAYTYFWNVTRFSHLQGTHMF